MKKLVNKRDSLILSVFFGLTLGVILPFFAFKAYQSHSIVKTYKNILDAKQDQKLLRDNLEQIEAELDLFFTQKHNSLTTLDETDAFKDLDSIAPILTNKKTKTQETVIPLKHRLLQKETHIETQIPFVQLFKALSDIESQKKWHHIPTLTLKRVPNSNPVLVNATFTVQRILTQ